MHKPIANLTPQNALAFYRKLASRFSCAAVLTLTTTLCFPGDAFAFRVSDLSAFGLGVARWDAAPHFVDGVERSLDGGLRYSLQGGSYEAYRDLIPWVGSTPSVAEFRTAFEAAFAAWEAVDPATGLNTNLRFVPDFDTPVVAESADKGVFGLNRGAEIDFLVEDLSPRGFDAFVNGFVDPAANTVTLTSGVADYPAAVISGMDIAFDNNNPWTLAGFQDLLTKEIGIAILLGPADNYHSDTLSRFYDDNYDDSSSATALATLTNSFVDLIDPLDPDNSPGLELYDVCSPTDPGDPTSCYGDPGIDTPGVDLLMESSVTPGGMRMGLQNDEYAGRQFLYPYVPMQSGDFDGDGDVDGKDFLLWQQGGSPDPLSSEDLSAWQANYGVASSLASAHAVPEPSGILLVTIYLIAVTCRRRSSNGPTRYMTEL